MKQSFVGSGLHNAGRPSRKLLLVASSVGVTFFCPESDVGKCASSFLLVFRRMQPSLLHLLAAVQINHVATTDMADTDTVPIAVTRLLSARYPTIDVDPNWL